MDGQIFRMYLMPSTNTLSIPGAIAETRPIFIDRNSPSVPRVSHFNLDTSELTFIEMITNELSRESAASFSTEGHRTQACVGAMLDLTFSSFPSAPAIVPCWLLRRRFVIACEIE